MYVPFQEGSSIPTKESVKAKTGQSNSKTATLSSGNTETEIPSISYFQDQEDLPMKDIYLIGSEIIEKCNQDVQNKFYRRLQKKLDNEQKMTEVVRNITKSWTSHNSKIEWLNNLLEVRRILIEKIESESEEMDTWLSIWTLNLSEFKLNFSNEEDFDDDISTLKYEFEEYNTEAYEHLVEEIETALDKYLPDDKDTAIEKLKYINKELLQSNVEELWNYVTYRPVALLGGYT